ncbi:hypothetical protein HK102_003136 [Quaeritorhiza haematococci]|nr:hypothetical protein HK102_003136 [Quaeritorhiza haematococci]
MSPGEGRTIMNQAGRESESGSEQGGTEQDHQQGQDHQQDDKDDFSDQTLLIIIITVLAFLALLSASLVTAWLMIQASTIPRAGKGLFAMKRNAPNGTVLFRKNDVILEYVGEIISVSETNARYGEHTAVYTLRRNRSTDIDAACKRGVVAMANSQPGKNNARFGAAGRGENYRMVLRATKNILHGQEIFAHYGGNYRFNEPGVQYSTRNRSK